ncbi:MAG: alpha-amylase family glycosyl hydrolase, partial [Sulfuricaulis sp.]|nr:alpha-amylase family glycosyl hydrolase [Sulfuricaulis sp.]
QGVRHKLEPRYPEMVLLSEWGSPAAALSAGFHLDFLLHCGTLGEAYNSLLRNEPGRNVIPSNGHSFCDASGQGDITAFTKPLERELRAIRGRGRLAIASGNHDLPRLAYNRSPAECAVALAAVLTLPGVPFIYYGDEIGMRYQPDLVSKEGGYNRTGTRTPMQWTAGRNAGFSSAPAQRLYLPVDKRSGAPSVAAQEHDPASLLNQVRQLISVRRERAELFTDGEYRSIYAEKNAYPYVFLRRLGRERVLVVINPARRPVNVTLAAGLDSTELLAGSGVRLSKSGRGTRLSAKGISYGVFALR